MVVHLSSVFFLNMTPTRIFEAVEKTSIVNGTVSEIIDVWIPPVNHPEGELVLSISKSYVPALIATLRNISPAKSRPQTP